MNSFTEIVRSNRAWMCLDCGKCSSICPVTVNLVDRYTSPRLLVETALSSGEEAVLDEPLLWSCLTCGRCSQICPSGVIFSSFIQQARQLARGQNLTGDCTHGGVIQSWVRLMAAPDRVQNRLEWVRPELKIRQDSDTIYWPGCLPYYQQAFRGAGIEGIEIALAAISILNYMGLEPLLLEGERCCGHDQFWQGDRATFQKLAAINLESIKKSGAKRIVTTCPECAYTLKHTYPDEVGEHNLEVLHLVEFLDQVGFTLPARGDREAPLKSATYQDPCRLGRLAGIYQQPRDLIRQAGYDLVDMAHNREASICCGTSCWSNCGQANQRIQAARLQEASDTGAETLITSCIKCQIHLNCAQKGFPEAGERVKIRDLAVVLAEGLPENVGLGKHDE